MRKGIDKVIEGGMIALGLVYIASGLYGFMNQHRYNQRRPEELKQVLDVRRAINQTQTDINEYIFIKERRERIDKLKNDYDNLISQEGIAEKINEIDEANRVNTRYGVLGLVVLVWGLGLRYIGKRKERLEYRGL